MKAEECIPLEIIQMLSKKWALLILSLLYSNQKLRYSELADKLEGISPKTLTERLRELEKEGIIRRESFSEIPPRVEYYLTQKGSELAGSFTHVLKWAEKWYVTTPERARTKPKTAGC
ncbi:MAG TPA: helix-turn-helix domain-containing protein [Candidatus Bathyarchaeia archaeon]|nr:helix-turn-helix domain-containing protein [Candidatus Bathyarchaeia archaeon]